MELKRGLGPVEAMALVVGGTIGASIFLVPAAIAQEVGSPGLELATWLLTGLLALCGALSFAELAGAIPETGGTYQFLKRAYPGTPIAFLFGWMMFFAYAAGATAVTSSLAAQYAGQFLPGLGAPGSWGTRFLAVAIIMTLAAVNAIGVREGGRTQNVLTLLKVGGLLAVVAACFVLGDGSVTNYLPILPPDKTAAEMTSSVGTAMILTIFSYSGWYFITHVAGEVREPEKNLPRAIFGGMVVLIFLYLTINAAYLYVLPFEVLENSPRVAADAMNVVLGPAGATVIAVVVFLSGVGAANAQMLNYPRITFSLAKDGLFFEPLARIHPRRGTPAVAIMVFAVVASGFAMAGTYQQILTYVGFVGQLFMMLTVLGVIVLRVREPELPRPFRVPLYPLVPVVYIAILLWYLGNLLVNRFEASLVGIGIVAAGLPFYWYWSRGLRTQDSGLKTQDRG
ncbi:MAG: APC family permease [Gemmatimonadales bacterium]